jgi:hypothetical protein
MEGFSRWGGDAKTEGSNTGSAIGKVGTGFPANCATNKKSAIGKVGTGFPANCATDKKSAIGKVGTGFPANCATDKRSAPIQGALYAGSLIPGRP